MIVQTMITNYRLAATAILQMILKCSASYNKTRTPRLRELFIHSKRIVKLYWEKQFDIYHLRYRERDISHTLYLYRNAFVHITSVDANINIEINERDDRWCMIIVQRLLRICINNIYFKLFKSSYLSLVSWIFNVLYYIYLYYACTCMFCFLGRIRESTSRMLIVNIRDYYVSIQSPSILINTIRNNSHTNSHI